MLDSRLPDPLVRLRQIIDGLEKYRLDIEKALCYNERTWTFDQVCSDVLSGKIDMYDLSDAVVLCQLVEQPNANIYHVFIAAGNLDSILSFAQNGLLHEAKLRGCSTLSMEGRTGWKRSLEKLGWSTRRIVMVKGVY